MAATKPAATLGSRIKAFVDSPTGLKTTHFWGPVANWGFVLAVREKLEKSERADGASAFLRGVARRLPAHGRS